MKQKTENRKQKKSHLRGGQLLGLFPWPTKQSKPGIDCFASLANARRQAGLSLIEVVISMFMLSVLLVFYASALNLVALSRRMRNENLAYHVANKQMETLRDTPLAALAASGSINDPMLTQLHSGTGNFTVADYPGFTGMKEMVVTVSWNDGANKSVVLKTLAGSGGINP